MAMVFVVEQRDLMSRLISVLLSAVARSSERVVQRNSTRRSGHRLVMQLVVLILDVLTVMRLFMDNLSLVVWLRLMDDRCRVMSNSLVMLWDMVSREVLRCHRFTMELLGRVRLGLMEKLLVLWSEHLVRRLLLLSWLG